MGRGAGIEVVGVVGVVEMIEDYAGIADSVGIEFELVGNSGCGEMIDFEFVVGIVDSDFDW